MAEPLSVRDVEGDHARVGEAKLVDLSTVEVVLLRQDPPFDLAYIATTHLLERIHPKTLVVNRPDSHAPAVAVQMNPIERIRIAWTRPSRFFSKPRRAGTASFITRPTV